VTRPRDHDRADAPARVRARARARSRSRNGAGGRAASAPAWFALALCCAALASGCGIRSTSVPVDAGAAPSHVGCVLPDEAETSGADGGKGNRVERVYLVCGSRVSPVERRVGVREDGAGPESAKERLTVARTLLDALKTRPYGDEQSAGFDTSVPGKLKVSGPHKGDPEETLRLSAPLDRLPSFALAQIVCTYADTAELGSSDQSVILGGPSDVSGLPQRFECSTALRTRPGAATTAGTRVSGP
jgi:hypothetical protein